MGSAWWNLTLRFLLELAALFGLGLAGWKLAASPWSWIAVVIVPLAAASAWGVFNVPGDPSRSGAAPVPVPGTVRLALEFVVLFGGAAGLIGSGYSTIGYAMAAVIVLHYALSWDRIGWLVRK